MVLLTKDQHMSADKLLEQVNLNSPVASKATIYNTLGLFVEYGLVREVIVDSKKVFYDSNTKPHHHFYNVDTGSLHDIDISQVQITNLPTPPDAAVIKDVNIVFRVEKTPGLSVVQDNSDTKTGIANHRTENQDMENAPAVNTPKSLEPSF
jgi:Fur family iron response transcriptional regulator